MTYTLKRSFARGYLIMVFMMVLAMAFPMVVYADDFNASAAKEEAQSLIDEKGSLPSGLRASKNTSSTAPEGSFVLTLDGDAKWHVTTAQLEAWKSGVGTIRGQIEQEASAITQVKPDIGEAFNIFSGVQGPIQVILGIIALAIMHVLPLSAALDTLYLISPEFSNKVEEKKESSNGSSGMVREGKNGKKYMRWISREAQDALEKSYETGQPPYKQFLVFLIIKYVMAAILMAFVFTGNYMQLLYGAMDLISGLTGMLG